MTADEIIRLRKICIENYTFLTDWEQRFINDTKDRHMKTWTDAMMEKLFKIANESSRRAASQDAKPFGRK